MVKWLDANVEKRIDWNPHLFSLQMTCPQFPLFKAGQFVKIGLETPDGQLLSRPYSLVNPPHNHVLEILAVPVLDGSLSPKLQDLTRGDAVKVMSTATGYLTMDEVPPSQHLFMLATGTGVGPFLSIIQSNAVWKQHDKVILIYAARTVEDLAYQTVIKDIQQRYAEQFIFIPVTSREANPEGLKGRIPSLIRSQAIQQYCGLPLSAQTSQVMICGNPEMIKDSIEVLTTIGLKKHLRRSPGQISMERYW